MARRRDQSKGIFCLEACAWFGGLKDRTSVEPVLRLLETAKDYRVPYLHHDVGTRHEFDFYLEKWKQPRFANYPILYLGFHGTPRSIEVGEGEDKAIELTDLAERLETSCAGRIVHFGACSTLAAPDELLDKFLDRTGALAVSGYGRDVYWLESAAFEVLLLGYLQKFSFTRRGMGAVKRRVSERASRLEDALRFRMKVNHGLVWFRETYLISKITPARTRTCALTVREPVRFLRGSAVFGKGR